MVTDRLKVFLNRGDVPLVLVGDEQADAFFSSNPKLRARFPKGLKLAPLDPINSKTDKRLFKQFCNSLNDAIFSLGFLPEKTDLNSGRMLSALAEVSNGHVGRVARLFSIAFPEAVGRGADRIEAYDLSKAVRTYAIGNGWIDHDPFVEWDVTISDSEGS